MPTAVSFKLNSKRETFHEQILDILEDRILRGEYPPGTRLSEALVSQEFGVSRIPAREALLSLQEMNLVRKTHLGREVASISLEEFREIYELKNVIEAFGAMQGSLKSTPQDLKKIQTVMDSIGENIKADNVNKVRHLNYQFHDLLVHCSGNRVLIKTYLKLAKKVRWSTSLLLQDIQRPSKGYAEHQGIWRAFRQKKAHHVRSLIENHSNINMERICKLLGSQESRRKGEKC